MSTGELVCCAVQLHQLQSSEEKDQIEGVSVCCHLLQRREISAVGVLTTAMAAVR